jgi:hypothetical protein
VTVRNAEGEDVAERDCGRSTSECRHDWERIELTQGLLRRIEAWTISVPRADGHFTCASRACRPIVACSRSDALFVPERYRGDAAVPQPTGDAPSLVASPLTGGGEALCAADLAWAWRSSHPMATPLMNETEGTIEMWVRDTRQHDDLHNRSILCAAATLHLVPAHHASAPTSTWAAPAIRPGMVLPQDRWVHLAATWRPSTQRARAQTEVALYIDGVRVETSYNRHLSPRRAGPRRSFCIPATTPAGLYVDELRVSDVARYEGNFDRPEAPFEPDANTLILSHFEDDTALVTGTRRCSGRRGSIAAQLCKQGRAGLHG